MLVYLYQCDSFKVNHFNKMIVAISKQIEIDKLLLSFL